MTRSISDLSYNELLELEEHFNQVKVMGMPLGAAMGKALQYDLSRQRPPSSTMSTLKLRLKVWNLGHASGSLWRNQKDPEVAGSVLFCLTNPTARIWAFFEPLRELLQHQQIIVAGKSKGSIELPFWDLNYLSPTFKEQWNTTRSSLLRQMGQALDSLPKNIKLNSYSALMVKQLMLIQAQRLVGIYGLLHKNKPLLVITDHDRQNLNSCLILAANQLEIPTYTFIHGSTHPPKAYLPFLAHNVLCWGQNHVDQFKSLGINTERLLVVGNPKIHKITTSDHTQLKQQLALPDNKRVCLLATNNIENGLRWQLARSFCAAFDQLPQWQAVVRLHPLESLSDYEALVQEFPKVTFVSNDQWTVAQTFQVASAIIVHNSVFGLEAMMQQVAVGVMDVLPISLGIGEDFINQAGSPRLEGSADLVYWLRKMEQASSLEQQVRQSHDYTANHCSALGTEAAHNIFTYLKHHVPAL